MKARARRWQPLLYLSLAFAGLLAALPARGDELPEYRLKAAFLYNFVAFTEWPAEVGSMLNLCIFGPDPFGAEIEPLQGKVAASRKIELHRISSPGALKGCQVVFVAAPAIDQLPGLREAARGLPLLMVADSPGAARQGAMLNMTLTQGKVSFEANLLAARSARLNLSSKLLRLATEVIQ